MQTAVEVLLCPVCGTTVRHTVRHNGFQAGGTSIGAPAIACPGCGTSVCTGQMEWDEKGLLSKFWFVLTRLSWMMAASIFVAGFFGMLVGWCAVEFRLIRLRQQGLYTLVAYLAGTLPIVVILGRNALKEIRESRQRTRAVDSES